jgi:hypothetical protein
MFKKILEKKLTYAAGEKLRSYLPVPKFLSVTFAVTDTPLSDNRAIICGFSILNVIGVGMEWEREWLLTSCGDGPSAQWILKRKAY